MPWRERVFGASRLAAVVERGDREPACDTGLIAELAPSRGDVREGEERLVESA